MKILVFSDSHGESALMSNIISAMREEIDMVIFAGDCVSDFTDFQYIFPDKVFYCVKGNCDYGNHEPAERLIDAGEKKIFLTHGHMYGVKSGHMRIMEEAHRHGADICLYGHSHEPAIYIEQEVYFMCPGSISEPRRVYYPTYGLIDIVNDAVSLKIIGVEEGRFITHSELD